MVAAFAASGVMDLSGETATAGTEATKAMDLIDDRLRGETSPEEFLIVESQTATTDEAAFSGFVDSLVGDLRALEDVDSVVSYRDGAEGLVSDDGHVALIMTTLTGDEEDAADTAEPLVDAVEEVDGTEGFRVTTVGFGSVEGEINTLMGETLEQGELIGITVALVILLFVFGAAVAAGLPIILALLSIFVAVGATALVSNVMDMSEFIVFIITMIGLAVGIDYSLFIVQRFREERSRGRADAPGGRSPEGCQRAPGPRHRGDHPGYVFPCSPGPTEGCRRGPGRCSQVGPGGAADGALAR